MKSLYLVTGGAGFIGSHLVDALLGQGHRVRVLDNFATGKRENLQHVLSRIDLREGDIRSFERVKEAMQGVDFVLHQAALGSVPRSVADPLTTNEVNITGTLNLLIHAREAGVKKFVFASSSSIYGPTKTLPKREDMPPNPASPYALSKYAGERYCQLFCELYGLPTVCLRYFNVFGPRQDPASEYSAVIPKFINALLSGQAPTIYGDGEQSRDFTYVDNAVSANLLAVKAAASANGKVFNVGCGGSTTLNELIALLADILKLELKPRYQPARPGDVRHSHADVSQARAALGYEPSISVEEGLQRTVAWFQESPTISVPEE